MACASCVSTPSYAKLHVTVSSPITILYVLPLPPPSFFTDLNCRDASTIREGVVLGVGVFTLIFIVIPVNLISLSYSISGLSFAILEIVFANFSELLGLRDKFRKQIFNHHQILNNFGPGSTSPPTPMEIILDLDSVR